jgi:hypothetical protein
MSTQYANGKIVTSGLVLALDAADRNSYPGSGTTWNDLSGNGYNGTLTNGPTFNSGNGGSIVFDGTNDYVTGSGLSSFDLSTNQNYSICTWINPTFADTSATSSAIFNYSGPGASFLRTYLRWEGTSLGFYLDTADSGGGSAWRFKPTFAANTWNCLCFTHTSANTGLYYFNGISYAPTIAASNPKTGVTGFAATIGYGSVNSYYWRGNIATISIYDRVLSPQEILQNYNAQKSRFNL